MGKAFDRGFSPWSCASFFSADKLLLRFYCFGDLRVQRCTFLSRIQEASGFWAMSIAVRFFSFFLCFIAILGNVEREAPVVFSARGHGDHIVSYAEIRSRVAFGFIEKANEIADAVAVFQDLTKATSKLSEQIAQHCSK